MTDDKTEVRGREAMEYAIEHDLSERVLRIEAVEPGRLYPGLPASARVVRFANFDGVFVLNKPNEQIMRAAFGHIERGRLKGMHVRIHPQQHIDMDGRELFDLRLQPLWRCQQCGQEWANNPVSKTCAWCQYGKERSNG